MQPLLRLPRVVAAPQNPPGWGAALPVSVPGLNMQNTRGLSPLPELVRCRGCPHRWSLCFGPITPAPQTPLGNCVWCQSLCFPFLGCRRWREVKWQHPGAQLKPPPCRPTAACGSLSCCPLPCCDLRMQCTESAPRVPSSSPWLSCAPALRPVGLSHPGAWNRPHAGEVGARP